MSLNTLLNRYPILRFLIGQTLSLLLAMLIITVSLNLTASDINQLGKYMAVMGVVTLSVSYGFYRYGMALFALRLRWIFLWMIILTVMLVLLNVWVIARLMFVDFHYVGLTTALLIFAGLSAIVLGNVMSRSLTDRIDKLCDAAHLLAIGHFHTRIPIDGRDELAELANSFNIMAASLEKLEEQKREVDETRKNLIAWVSHDLRTPLASVRVMIEAISDGVVTDKETMNRYLSNCRAEIEHLNRLINDLFDLAQLDVGHINFRFYPASIRDLISDTLESMGAKARRSDIRLVGNVADDVDVAYIAVDKIQRVLYNLVDNAIKYTPSGETVTISAHNVGQFLQLCVHNSGASITPRDLPNIFKSFYRADGSRVKTDHGERGVGLGLAIAKAFVEAHGGNIWVESSAIKGTSFYFTLPRQPQKG